MKRTGPGKGDITDIDVAIDVPEISDVPFSCLSDVPFSCLPFSVTV